MVFGRLVRHFRLEKDLKVTLEFGSFGDRFIVVFTRSGWSWSLFGGQVSSVLLLYGPGPCSLMTQLASEENNDFEKSISSRRRAFGRRGLHARA